MSAEPAARLVSPESGVMETGESSLRPLSFDSFTGQAQAVRNLRVFVTAARERGEALDHVLFHGPPGLGKTTLAHIVARELGVNFHATSGPILTKPGDLAAILTNLARGDVLFIDEIHRLPIAVEEMLYPALEDFKIDLVVGEGPAARSLRLDLPPFTLVGATTRLGLLSNPLRDRFGIPLRLEFYTPAELALVLQRAASVLSMVLEPAGARELAARSRGTPRIAVRLLRRVRDFADAERAASVGKKLADHALKLLEVDERGLDAADRRYLAFIADHYAGGPVGVETIAAGLSEQRDTLEETIEPFLMQAGFLQRTPRGRMLTPGAYAHLGRTPPRLPPQDLFAEDGESGA